MYIYIYVCVYVCINTYITGILRIGETMSIDMYSSVCVCVSVHPHLHGFFEYLSAKIAFLTARSKWPYSLWSHRHHHDLCSIPQGAATLSHGLAVGNHREPLGTMGFPWFSQETQGSLHGMFPSSNENGNCHRAAGHCWRLAGLGIEVFQGSYIGLGTSVSGSTSMGWTGNTWYVKDFRCSKDALFNGKPVGEQTRGRL